MAIVFKILLLSSLMYFPSYAMEKETAYSDIETDFNDISSLEDLFHYIYSKESEPIATIKKLLIEETVDSELFLGLDSEQIEYVFLSLKEKKPNLYKIVLNKINDLRLKIEASNDAKKPQNVYSKALDIYKKDYLQNIAQKLNSDNALFQESEQKSEKQIKSIAEYAENATKKITQYQEKIYNYLSIVDSNFYAVICNSDFVISEKTTPYERNTVGQIYHFMISQLKMRAECENDQDTITYLNILRGFALALLLDIHQQNKVEFLTIHGDLYFGYKRRIQTTIANKLIVAATKIKENINEDIISLLISSFRENYSLFKYVPPIFLYDDEAIFEPRSLNHAKSLGPFDLFALMPTPILLHMNIHYPWSSITHDYAHYSDTVLDFYIDSKMSPEAFAQFVSKFGSYFYNLIENSKSFATLPEKVLAHYLLMYIFRDLYIYGEFATNFITYSKDPKAFINYMLEYVRKEHFTVISRTIKRQLRPIDYHNNYLSVIRFFPDIKNDLFVPEDIAYRDESGLLKLGFDVVKTFAFHEALIAWFCDKCLEASTENSWSQFVVKDNKK